MKIQITARHFHASAQLHQNLKDDLEKLAKFNDSITSAHVILDAGSGGTKRAEAVVKILEKSVCAHADDESMGRAIESMLEKVERQLKKEKEKLKLHRGTPKSEAVSP